MIKTFIGFGYTMLPPLHATKALVVLYNPVVIMYELYKGVTPLIANVNGLYCTFFMHFHAFKSYVHCQKIGESIHLR